VYGTDRRVVYSPTSPALQMRFGIVATTLANIPLERRLELAQIVPEPRESTPLRGSKTRSELACPVGYRLEMLAQPVESKAAVPIPVHMGQGFRYGMTTNLGRPKRVHG
jgi:hypothetical protein